MIMFLTYRATYYIFTNLITKKTDRSILFSIATNILEDVIIRYVVQLLTRIVLTLKYDILLYIIFRCLSFSQTNTPQLSRSILKYNYTLLYVSNKIIVFQYRS